ncbi:hypothetical protein [Amycolatopsis japonica]
MDSADDAPTWCYDQRLKSGDRRYSAYVTTVSGIHGDRLRRRLNAAISELLQWAAHPEDDPPK